MRRVVDTNVMVAANGRAEQASPDCVSSCIDAILRVRSTGQIVIDDDWEILSEYGKNLRSTGVPGTGDAFYKWILTNRQNPHKCEQVHITPSSSADTSYEEFPDDSRLTDFDKSDHKFVATCLAHESKPPICQALDTKWRDFAGILLEYGVEIEFLC